MSPARTTFLVIFGLGVLLGVVIGVIKLVAPDAATVTLNGENVGGWTGFFTAVVSGAIPAAVFGLIVAGIVKLFTRKKRPAA
jgi:hypothetical protein